MELYLLLLQSKTEPMKALRKPLLLVLEQRNTEAAPELSAVSSPCWLLHSEAIVLKQSNTVLLLHGLDPLALQGTKSCGNSDPLEAQDPGHHIPPLRGMDLY